VIPIFPGEDLYDCAGLTTGAFFHCSGEIGSGQPSGVVSLLNAGWVKKIRRDIVSENLCRREGGDFFRKQC
jgi:hypothetical protein